MDLVIYDEGCPYCVMIARVLKISKKFEIQPYSSSEAQKILDEEFEDPGFTFYLFEDNEIFFGDKAAERTAQKFWRSKNLGNIFLRLYPALSKLFSVLSGGRNITQPECTEERCVVNTRDGGIVERTQKN